MLLAQYTDGKGIGLGGLFDNFKVNVDSYKKVIDDLKKIESFDNFIDPNGKANWDAIAKAIEGCDETALSYFKTLDDGNGTINNQSASIEGMSAYLKKSGQMFNFAAIKASLFNAAINSFLMLGISYAIKGIVWAFDTLANGAENANKKVEDSIDTYKEATSELESAEEELLQIKTRIEEIESMDSLSLSDEADLRRLQNESIELERQIALLKQRQLISARELMTDAKNAFNSSQIYGQHGRQSNQEAFETSLSEYENYQNAVIEKQKELDQFIADHKMLDLYDTEELNGDELHQFNAIQEQLVHAETAFNENKEIIEDSYEASAKLIEAYDLIRESGGMLTNSEELLYNQAKENQEAYLKYSYYVYDNADAYKALNEESKKSIVLQKLLSQGLSQDQAVSVVDSLSEDDLNKFYAVKFNFEPPNENDYKNAKEYGYNYASIMMDSIDEIFAETADIPIKFDFSTYEEDIDDIQSAVSTLRSALDSFNKGELDKESVLDLLQEFPALAKYTDLAAEGFGSLSEGLSELIAQQPDALIQNLESLKSMLNTEEEREQVDLLINSLQRLTSYGDTGNEAYAAATGNTWNDTANVIEGVTTQFENLAKVQEAVADGLTMSATAAAELAKMYPEILTQSEVTANGQIKLNEDVVKSILAGDQSIINAQITKLEADKAELTAKKENALAQLELANQVATGRSRLTEDELRLKIEAMNQELDGAIEKDTQISESFADTTDSVVDNMITMNDTAGNVASDIATNMGNAAENMAGNMAAGARAVQISLSDIMKKASDVAKSIAGMISGEIVGNADTIYQGAGSGGKRKKGIEIVKTASKQDSVTSSYLKDEITLDEFRNGLQTDISGYEQAISNIDSQIEVLKNLQLTFENTVSSANGGIGGHNYANKIKELEKEKDRINNALDNKKGSGSDKDEFEETVDYFERRIKVLDDAVNILKSGMENVTGAFARNNLLDAQLGITEEKFNNYTDAMAMYTQKANEALLKLPADIAEKVKNGAVDLTTYIGDGNKAVTEAINEYEKWSDKVTDCRQELEELKTAIRQLELEKFNNIMDDFTDQFDLRDDANSLIDKQIALLKEAGQLIGESFYTAQADQAKKQLALLEEEKAKLAEQLNSAIGSGRVQKGTEEWLEMVSALSDVDGSILDCKKSIEEFDNAILELHTEIFNRIQEQFSDLDTELSNLSGLFDDDSKVSDGLGNWINNGLAQLGLLTQQYELAKYRVQQYNTEIDELNKQYLAGKYSATEYTDKLADLTQGQWDSVSAMREAETSIMSLNETRIEEEIDTIEKEIDAFKKLTDAQIDALKSAKDLHEYQLSIAEKTKKVSDIERQLAAMQNDNSASTIAKRKKLEAELADAKKDLEETEYDHSIDEQEDALNKEYERFEQEKNDEIDKLRESLENRELMIGESFEAVKNNADIVGQEIVMIAQNHGVTVSNSLVSSWQKGEKAIASYGDVLSAGTSAFIGNIMTVESEVWNLQAQANMTADTLAYMFATRADTLVNELNTAYYSEANLNTMTQTLHDSLVNTLERGYNISSIMSSLESIKNAAIDAANAVNSVGAGGAGGNITQAAPAPATPSQVQSSGSIVQNAVNETLKNIYTMDTNPANGQYLIKNKLTGKVVSTHRTEQAAMNALKKLRGYASGTRDLEENLIIKDEEGYELTLPKLSEGRYAIEPTGTQILTKEQTDNLFRLAQMDPDMQKSVMIPNPARSLMKFPEMTERNITPQMNLHYDSLITLNGDVNDTNHFLKQIETVAQGAIKKSWKDAMWECKKKGAW